MRSKQGASTLGVAGLRVLATVSTPGERARQRLLTGAVALAASLLLASGRIARIGEFRAIPAPDDDAFVPPPLAPFVAQPGLRFGVVLGGLLVVVLVLVFALQVLRLGSSARRRRLSALRLAGATPAEIRRVAALRAARAGVIGGLLAGPGYLLLWLLLGILPPSGYRLLPAPIISDLGVWALVVLLMTVAVAGSGAMTGHRPRCRPALASRLVAGALWVGLLAAAAVLSVFSAGAAAWIVMLGLLVALGVPATRFVARRMAGTGRLVELLAASRLRAAPRTAGLLTGTLALGGFAIGAQAGVVGDTIQRDDAAFYVAGVGLAATATFSAIAVTLLALLVGAADRILDERRAQAALCALGADPSIHRRVLRRQLTAASAPAAAAGAVTSGLFLGSLGVILNGVPTMTAGVLAAPLAAAVVWGLAWAAVQMLSPLLSGASDPENLRAP